MNVDRFIKLANPRIDANLPEERLHAEGAGLVRNDRHDEFSNLRITQHFIEHAHEDHGCGHFATFTALGELREYFVMVRFEGSGTDGTSGYIPAKRLSTRTEVLNFLAIFGWSIERRLSQVVIAKRNAKARAELAKLVFIQLFLLMADVPSLTAFTEAVALDGAGITMPA